VDIFLRTIHHVYQSLFLPVMLKVPLMKKKPTYEELENRIQELEKAEAALLASEQRHRRIFENLQDVYYEASIDGTILEVSPSIEKFSLFRREELIGESLYNIYTDKNKRDEFIELILENGRATDYEVFLNDKDGTQRPCSISVVLIRDSKGSPEKLVGSARDIGERRQAEEAMRESEERYRQLFNIAPAGIYELDFRAMKFTNVNDAVCEYTGYSKDELLSMNPMDLLTEESQLLFIDRLDRIDKKKGVPKTAEYSARKKDGGEFVLSINARFIYEGDEIVGATVVAQDVTELKQASAALEAQNRLMNALLDNLQVGVFMVAAPSGKPLLANKRAMVISDNYNSRLKTNKIPEIKN